MRHSVRNHSARIVGTAIVLGLVVLLTVPATAGWFGFGKKKSDDEQQRPPRFDRHPPMTFHAGTLNRSVREGWSVGNLDLMITRDTQIRRMDDPEETAYLNDGAEVYVMGSRAGNVLICREVLVKPYVTLVNTSFGVDEERIIWSLSDPSVGVGTGPQ